MRSNWRQIARGGVHSEFAGFYVTLNPKGHLHLSRVTYHRMGAPEAFQVFFDEANVRIGLKPAAALDRDAYIAGRVGQNGGRQVRILRLLNECGIDLPATIRFYDADIDQEGFLVLDLRTARVPPAVFARAQRNKDPRLPQRRDLTTRSALEI